MVNSLTLEKVKCVIESKGYKLHSQLWYPNLIGVRDLSCVNTFNDYFIIIQKRQDRTFFKVYDRFTTDPGVDALVAPINKLGAGILKEGWHKNIWKRGKHKGMYDALVQNIPVPAYRDNNKDNEFDLDIATIDVGWHGANLHEAGDNSVIVGKWSYMCQVFGRRKDFREIRQIIYDSPFETFDYYLIEKKDF
jgi:hypothetical protein